MKKPPLKEPIVIVNHDPHMASHNTLPIDKHDPRHAEPLVRITEHGIAEDGSAVYLRQSVAAKLPLINAALEEYGVELLVRSGYRSIHKQKELWDMYMKQFKEQYPYESEKKLSQRMNKIVADPTYFSKHKSTTWPIHTCGGAIDLTLRNKETDTVVDMGNVPNDADPSDASDWYERQLQAGRIDENHIGLRNRRLLHWAMKQEGFTNYPPEFWHFDWGDQMFIKYSSNGETKAWYGYIEPPQE